jgi:hypothetical protein
MGLSCLAATSGASIAAGTANGSHHKSSSAVGSGLGAISASATASALGAPLYSNSGEDVEADVPYAQANLGTGGIGDGVTSALWPGSTGAHGGDTLNLLGIKQVPPSVAQELNDPEVAEAQTGVGPPTVSKSNPGLTMSSTATSTHVKAVSSAAGAGVPLLGPIVGTTSASSDIAITGASTLTADAVSSVHSISIAHLITIKAVTSTARAVSNGHSASGTARTTVGGVAIDGIPVRIDNKGLHVLGKLGKSGLGGLPIPVLGTTLGGTIAPTASAVVNQALKSAGIHIDLTKATRHVHGAHVTLDSGALVVRLGNASYKSQVNDTGTLFIIGGAQVDARTSPGFPPPAPIKAPPPPASTTHTTAGTAGTPGTPGTPAIPGTPATSSVGTAPQTAAPPQLAGNVLALPKGLRLLWVILALAGAGLFAFGMKRLPDQVLHTAGPACRLEDT